MAYKQQEFNSHSSEVWKDQDQIVSRFSIWKPLPGPCYDLTRLKVWVKVLSEVSIKFWADAFNHVILSAVEKDQVMKDLKTYKPLQLDHPKSESGDRESNSIHLHFPAVAFFIQTAPNVLIHASGAVTSKSKPTATTWNKVYDMRSHFVVYCLICSVNSNGAFFLSSANIKDFHDWIN